MDSLVQGVAIKVTIVLNIGDIKSQHFTVNCTMMQEEEPYPEILYETCLAELCTVSSFSV